MTDPFLEALQKQGLEDVSIAAEGAKLLGYLDTGNHALNWIISGKFSGGWPLGHMVEIFGDPSTGKSYLVARAIASALQNNGVAFLDDTEGAFNAIWASTKLGVDSSRLPYRRSGTVEDHMEAVTAFVGAFEAVSKTRKIGPSVMALDSLALLTTKHELEVGLEKKDMTRAGEIRAMFRVLGSRLSAVGATYLVANHTIANIGNMYQPTTTPGGGGPKFQASVRLELRKSSRLKSGDDIIGVKVVAVVDKNRLAPPFRKTELAIPFFQPISPYSGLIGLLLSLKVLGLNSSGRILTLEGKEIGIPSNKSDFMKQDQSAVTLVTGFPTLLPDLDKKGGLGEAVGPLSEAVEDVSEPTEETPKA